MKLCISILLLFSNTYLFGQYVDLPRAIPFEKNCRYGLVKTDGNIIVHAKFKKVEELYPGIPLFVVTSVAKKLSLLNSKGESIIPIQFDSITSDYISGYNPEKDFVITVTQKGKKFHYTISGTRLNIKGQLRPVTAFCGNNDYDPQLESIFASNGKYGLIHKEEIQVKAIYDTIISRGEYFIAKTGNQAGVLTMYGDTTYPFGNYEFDYNSRLSGLLITDKNTNLKGFYAHTYVGICNLPCVYENITEVIDYRYFLVKEFNRCAYYYDFKTGKKFTE